MYRAARWFFHLLSLCCELISFKNSNRIRYRQRDRRGHIVTHKYNATAQVNWKDVDRKENRDSVWNAPAAQEFYLIYDNAVERSNQYSFIWSTTKCMDLGDYGRMLTFLGGKKNVIVPWIDLKV